MVLSSWNCSAEELALMNAVQDVGELKSSTKGPADF